MPCKIENDDGDWSGPVMLIMRGNSAPAGVYEDENRNTPAWPNGALHEQPAKNYATLLGFKPKVLDVSGDPGPSLNRAKSDGTLMALECFRAHPSITAFYGFSGGGYNLWHILNNMTEDERRRVKWVAVIGVDAAGKSARPRSDYESRNFKGGSWQLDYLANAADHMFLPEKFLERAAKNRVDAVTGADPRFSSAGTQNKKKK
jgi:hypothetical protein